MSLLEYFLSLPRYYSADQMRQSSRMYIQCFTFLSIGGNKRGCRERIAFTRTCSSSSLLLNVRITSETGNATTRTIFFTSNCTKPLSLSVSLSLSLSVSLSLSFSLCYSIFGDRVRHIMQKFKLNSWAKEKIVWIGIFISMN